MTYEGLAIIDFRVRPPLRDDPADPEVPLPEFMRTYRSVYGLHEKIQMTSAELDEKSRKQGIDVCVLQAELEEPKARMLNDRTRELVDRDAAHYVGFGGVDATVAGAREEAVRALDELDLRGINLQPWATGVAPSDPSYDWVWELCTERAVPVTVHTGMNFHRQRSMEIGNPIAIDDVAGRFPGLTIVMNHGGWPWLDEAMAILWRHPNVYVEYGAIAPKRLGEPRGPWAAVRPLLEDWLGPKVLFATDWPTISFRRAVEQWLDLDLPPAILRDVLAGNAARILGLEYEQLGASCADVSTRATS